MKQNKEKVVTYVRIKGQPVEAASAFFGVTIKEAIVRFAEMHSGIVSQGGLSVIACRQPGGTQWPRTVRRAPTQYVIDGMRGGNG